MEDKRKIRRRFILIVGIIAISVLTFLSLNAPESSGGFFNQLGSFASNSKVATVLLTLGLVCLSLELLIPGFTFLGIIGIISIVLFFLGSIYSGSSTVFSLLMTIVGAILIAVEVVIPGFGLPGISGIIFIVIGFAASMNSISQGITAVVISFFATLVTIYLAIRLGIETRTFELFTLSNRITDNPSSGIDVIIGDIGITNSVLRPSGYVFINNKVYDAKSSGSYIDKGIEVEVIDKKGNEIIVREVTDAV